MRAAQKLRSLMSEDELEIVIDAESSAPKSVAALSDNPAFFMIFHRYVRSSEDRTRQWGHLVAFVHMVRQLQREANPAVRQALTRQLVEDYLGANSRRSIAGILAEAPQSADELRAAVARPKGAQEERHAFDGALTCVLGALDAGCLKGFLSSHHYRYVDELRLRLHEGVSLELFQISRLLGAGGFGRVYEVVKRDSGKRYAMKAMNKAALRAGFGEDMWAQVAQLEREALGALHHPLLINLAYAFQNGDFLFLLMDLCEAGDLEDL